MTTGADMMQALVTRLGTIKQAVGYSLDVAKVHYPLGFGDQQPMAAELAEHELPAIIVYQGPIELVPEHHLISAFATIYLELVRPWCGDAVMWAMVADVGKAIFGGTSDATENTKYRFHPSVTEPRITKVIPDFGMLPTHRVWVVCLLIHYRVRYTNL